MRHKSSSSSIILLSSTAALGACIIGCTSVEAVGAVLAGGIIVDADGITVNAGGNDGALSASSPALGFTTRLTLFDIIQINMVSVRAIKNS